ncbi:MAG: ATP-binding cassette domain-containing protein [Dermatophilaceae bacterium]
MNELARVGWRAAPGPTVVMLGCSVLVGACGFVIPLFIGRAVGLVPSMVEDGVSSAFVVVMVALSGLLVLSSLGSVAADAGASIAEGLVRQAVELRIGWTLSSEPDVGRLEDEEASRVIQVVRARLWEISFGHLALCSALPGPAVVLVGASISLGVMLAWWVPLVVALPVLFTAEHARRSGLSEMEVLSGQGEHQKHAAFAFAQGMGPGAKETRIFGLSGFLRHRVAHHQQLSLGPFWRRRRDSAVIGLGWSLLGSAAVLVVVVWTVGQFTAGRLTLAQVAAALPLIVAVVNVDLSPIELVARAAAAVRSLDDIARAEELTDATPSVVVNPHAQSSTALVESVAQRHEVPPPGGDAPEIVFEDVTFTYPGRAEPVVDGVDLVLPAGQASALVGVNGAGKSTLVKLIAAAYLPTSGRILIDGDSTASFDREQRAHWQRRIAPVGQDFLRLPLSIGDNVELGSGEVWSGMIETDHYPDTTTLDRVARRAGIADLVADMDRRWATPLDATMPGGTDLSGGEWQRVGLARALRAVDAGARVLILDEPAAALDVESESRLVTGYLHVARATTSLIISHRFSVVRPVTHIHVLDGGRIVESGSHDELMDTDDGIYRGLFLLQAARYAAAEEDAR